MPIVPSKQELLEQYRAHVMGRVIGAHPAGVEPGPLDFSVFRARGERILPYYLADTSPSDPGPALPGVPVGWFNDLLEKVAANVKTSAPSRYVIVWDSLGTLGEGDAA